MLSSPNSSLEMQTPLSAGKYPPNTSTMQSVAHCKAVSEVGPEMPVAERKDLGQKHTGEFGVMSFLLWASVSPTVK